jgi:hypothetical protein
MSVKGYYRINSENVSERGWSVRYYATILMQRLLKVTTSPSQDYGA